MHEHPHIRQEGRIGRSEVAYVAPNIVPLRRSRLTGMVEPPSEMMNDAVMIAQWACAVGGVTSEAAKVHAQPASRIAVGSYQQRRRGVLPAHV